MPMALNTTHPLHCLVALIPQLRMRSPDHGFPPLTTLNFTVFHAPLLIPLLSPNSFETSESSKLFHPDQLLQEEKKKQRAFLRIFCAEYFFPL